MKTYWQIFWTALRLGLTSFGGPTAHLGYFQQTYVKEKKWLSNQEFTDLVALSQFIPGPASSQVGIGIGLKKGGIIGSIISFIGFTMPTVLVLMIFATYAVSFEQTPGWLQGLKLVAVAIIAHAIIDMSKKLIRSSWHAIIAVIALIILLLYTTVLSQIAVLIGAAIFGYVFIKEKEAATDAKSPLSMKFGALCLLLFSLLLIAAPILSGLWSNEWLQLFEKFYTAGALVFGGGHVVLPLLQTQFVDSGMVTADHFIAGYGATQAVPGPLFTFAAYIGMVIGGVPTALWAIFAIFLPAFLLLFGTYPFWHYVSQQAKLRGAISGMNAAVVSILVATFISPVITQSIGHIKDVVIAVILFLLLFKIKPMWAVLISILLGLIMY